MIAKGQTQPDGTYLYTCLKCGGKGGDCPDCYGLDSARILAAMKDGARGERYYALLKAFLSVNGKAITDEGKRIYAERDGLRPIDLGYISLKFGLNFKATVEWLEETVVIPGNTYERIINHPRVTVKLIYEKARETYGLTEDGVA